MSPHPWMTQPRSSLEANLVTFHHFKLNEKYLALKKFSSLLAGAAGNVRLRQLVKTKERLVITFS